MFLCLWVSLITLGVAVAVQGAPTGDFTAAQIRAHGQSLRRGGGGGGCTTRGPRGSRQSGIGSGGGGCLDLEDINEAEACTAWELYDTLTESYDELDQEFVELSELLANAVKLNEDQAKRIGVLQKELRQLRRKYEIALVRSMYWKDQAEHGPGYSRSSPLHPKWRFFFDPSFLFAEYHDYLYKGGVNLVGSDQGTLDSWVFRHMGANHYKSGEGLRFIRGLPKGFDPAKYRDLHNLDGYCAGGCEQFDANGNEAQKQEYNACKLVVATYHYVMHGAQEGKSTGIPNDEL